MFKSAYSVRRRYFTEVGSESLTKECFKDECDINRIWAKYMKTGVLDHVKSIEGVFGDFTDAKDYQESLNAINAAGEAFMSLPSDVRTRFENDPARLMDFLSDSSNLDEAVKLGLAVKPVVEPGAEPANSNPS